MMNVRTHHHQHSLLVWYRRVIIFSELQDNRNEIQTTYYFLQVGAHAVHYQVYITVAAEDIQRLKQIKKVLKH